MCVSCQLSPWIPPIRIPTLHPLKLFMLFIPEFLNRSHETWYIHMFHAEIISTKKNPWPESASEVYRPSDRRLSATLVPTFADRRWHMVNATDPYGRILGFLDREFFSTTYIISASNWWYQHYSIPNWIVLLTSVRIHSTKLFSFTCTRKVGD
jgi:hypothetical protein